MKSILIIGGCGYIGSRLFGYLGEFGYKINTLDLEYYGNYVNTANIRRNFIDITSDELDEYDLIIFLAGHSSVQMSNNNRREALENNVLNFYDLLQKVGDKKIIYASSSSVYNGTVKRVAGEGDASFDFNNMYDLTKLFADNLAVLYSRNFYGLRFGTVCGHSPNLRTDVMINKMVFSAINDGKITIYNKEINRPILGILDLCRAIHNLIEQDSEPGIYNLASFNSTIQEIGCAVADIMKVPLIDMGQTNTYDFKISSEKFIKSYKFEFNQSIENITNELTRNWSSSHKGVRV